MRVHREDGLQKCQFVEFIEALVLYADNKLNNKLSDAWSTRSETLYFSAAN